MDSEEILNLLRFGESINLECKKAETKFPNSVWETYSSFANTDGGVILFGVEEHMKETDDDKRFSFVSIHNPEQRLKDFWNTVNSEKVSSNILVDANAGICEVKGAIIMWIQIPQADYQQKPIYINGNPMKGTFKRNHEGDYHCTEEEVKAMLRDANESGNDGGLLIGYTMDDIDLNSLRSYRIEFEHRNPEHIWNGNDDRVPLKNLYDLYKDSNRVLMIGDHNAIELKGYISKCRFFVGARTHATIAAYSSRVPTLVAGYSVKSKGIARDIFGTEEGYVVDSKNIRSDQQFVEAFAWLYNNEDIVRSQLVSKMPEYIQNAYAAVEIIKTL